MSYLWVVMAMNPTALGSAMAVAVLAAIAAYVGEEADDHRLGTYTATDFWQKVCNAMAAQIVAHITANAKCNGADSGGDTHSAVGIV